MGREDTEAAEAGARLLAELWRRRPLVHHLANFVTMGDVAAVTRAVGASPIMAIAPDEVSEIVDRADALVVNLGTPTAERLAAIERAVDAACRRAIPVIIDPVGAGVSALRTQAARRVVAAAARPLVRANPAEAAALAGRKATLRGVETEDRPELEEVVGIAASLAARGAIVAVTGARDVITDGSRVLVVDNGHPWLAAVVGAGCMATAVAGCFAAAAGQGELVTAAAAGLACFGLAAERAAARSYGPGTMKPHLVDALFAMTPEELQAGIRWTELPPP
ncbi:MAG: hydroxyethylthiazole kinase [Armatimonadota bacterium]|nr:hydroxyethylthiazole kinase [Armatimonadota bacterium]MDR7465372.1 hydroxyethylthiazole kinase [Armatimonadota bacterium]MDR7468718.1 hydroxyethylthiazole kinase [Armatimonadota bacterium]MDR7474837.1 hydroxyethylthiazole kinase [Armatimonadota bacterium]MDR7538546.1 hydroxyethylthiazole kinase [Armatimonadota bacterium]